MYDLLLPVLCTRYIDIRYAGREKQFFLGNQLNIDYGIWHGFWCFSLQDIISIVFKYTVFSDSSLLIIYECKVTLFSI